MNLDIYLTTTLLFVGMTVLSDKPLLLRHSLYPAVLLYIVSGLKLGYSDFSIIKMAFVLYALTSPLRLVKTGSWEPSTPGNKNRDQTIAGLYMLGLIVAIIILWSGSISAEIISYILIGASAIMNIVDLVGTIKIRGQKGEEAQEDGGLDKRLYGVRFEFDIILLCGAILAGVSKRYLSQYFAILMMLIHLLVSIFHVFRRKKKAEASRRTRLEKLENKFSIQVEQEAKKLSRGMKGKVQEIEEKSMRDPLTRVPNRAMVSKRVQELMDDEYIRMFSLALIDLDNFKGINDTLGHVTGDKCLLNLTEFFMKNKRRNDIFGRFGGDEFIIIMPNVGADEALKALDYHRKIIDDNSNPHITITAGISVYPDDGDNLKTLLEAADNSLYAAKDAGKNQVKYIGNWKFTK